MIQHTPHAVLAKAHVAKAAAKDFSSNGPEEIPNLLIRFHCPVIQFRAAELCHRLHTFERADVGRQRICQRIVLSISLRKRGRAAFNCYRRFFCGGISFRRHLLNRLEVLWRRLRLHAALRCGGGFFLCRQLLRRLEPVFLVFAACSDDLPAKPQHAAERSADQSVIEHFAHIELRRRIIDHPLCRNVESILGHFLKALAECAHAGLEQRLRSRAPHRRFRKTRGKGLHRLIHHIVRDTLPEHLGKRLRRVAQALGQHGDRTGRHTVPGLLFVRCALLPRLL